MPSRIADRFASLRRDNRAGLISFVTAGDPDYETSLALVKGLPAAGADIIELGMAFSDPMADGPAVEAGGLRALKAGITLKKTLTLVSEFRRNDVTTPIVLMGYFNPIHRYGVEAFAADAVRAGIDGLIVVDLPPEEEAELRKPATAAGLDLIRLVTPTTNEARLAKVLEHASGFLYYVSVAGITGTKSASSASVGDAVERFRKTTQLPVAVGFGIKTPAQAAEVAKLADAAVVGSAIVEKIAVSLTEEGYATPALTETVLGFVRELAQEIHKAR